MKFKYLKDPKNDRRVVTIAYRWSPTFDDSVEYGVSVCNPEDKHVKKLARRIATERMKLNRHGLFSGVAIVEDDEKVLSAIAEDVLIGIGWEKARQTNLFTNEPPTWPASLERVMLDFLGYNPSLEVEDDDNYREKAPVAMTA